MDNLPRSRGIGDGRLACRGAQTAGYSPGFATTCPAPLTAQLYANSISCPSPKKSFDAVHVSHWYTTRRSSPLTNASPAAAAGAEHLGQCQTAGVRGGVLGFGFMVGFSVDLKQTGPSVAGPEPLVALPCCGGPTALASGERAPLCRQYRRAPSRRRLLQRVGGAKSTRRQRAARKRKTRGDHEGHRGFNRCVRCLFRRRSRAGCSDHIGLKRPWMAFQA